MEPLVEAPPSPEELKAVEKERAEVRRRIAERRLGALQTIAGLRPDQCHAAPEIARAALRKPRDPS